MPHCRVFRSDCKKVEGITSFKTSNRLNRFWALIDLQMMLIYWEHACGVDNLTQQRRQQAFLIVGCIRRFWSHHPLRKKAKRTSPSGLIPQECSSVTKSSAADLARWCKNTALWKGGQLGPTKLKVGHSFETLALFNKERCWVDLCTEGKDLYES